MSEPAERRALRITILTQFFDPEPVAIPGMPLARWLSERGHRVRVVTGFPNYPGGKIYPGYRLRPFKKEVVDGIRILRVGLYPSHDSSALGRVVNYLTFALSASVLGTVLSPKSDVTYVYHPPATAGLPAIIWKKIRKQPFVFHVQDLWPESVVGAGMIRSPLMLGLVTRALTSWCSFVYRQADSLAVLSPGMKELVADKGVEREKIHVVWNWADEEIFHPDPPDPELARSLGLEGRFNVVYAGNLGPYQGLETAVRAADRVRHLESFRLCFIGVGQAEHSLRQLVAELELENVTFIGKLPYEQMGSVTNLASMLLVSLRDLPFFAGSVPGKTQVALCAGKPLIVAVPGDAARLVAKAGAGLVCPPEDELALAAAFEQGYGLSQSQLDAMGERGRRYYLEELSFEKGAGRLEQLLHEAAGRVRDAGTPDSQPIASNLKRGLDVVIAANMVVFLSPLFAFCAILVRLTMGRPILFRQLRLGLNGQEFVMMKFRTMSNRSAGGDPADHERLTPVGALLRRFSLDELPQLINVLRGEMSLVGPRPLLPEYWNRYTPRQKRRNEVLPGMTGPVQVFGRNSLAWDEKFEMDVQYVENWSLWTDIKILLITALRVVRPSGVAAQGHATMAPFQGSIPSPPKEAS